MAVECRSSDHIIASCDLFQSQRKAGDQLKLLEMMVTHKSHTGKRLEDDKREIGNDLKFYYEKFEKVFSYISPEQWKLFDFVVKCQPD